MLDFKFFMKSVLLTIVLVIFMQIQVGQKTIETHATSWLQSSVIVSPLNSVAQGAVRMLRDVTGKVSNKVMKKDEVKDKKEEKKASSFRWTHDIKPAAQNSEQPE